MYVVRVAGPDDVHKHKNELDALRQANAINLQFVADCLKNPGDIVLCVATVHYKCPACLGGGEDWNEGDKCHQCNGAGYVGAR